VVVVRATTFAGRAEAEQRTDRIYEFLELLGRPPAWHDDAACREHPRSWWFDKNPTRAIEVCARCLVLDECRAWGLSADAPTEGVLGGIVAKDRRRLRLRAAR